MTDTEKLLCEAADMLAFKKYKDARAAGKSESEAFAAAKHAWVTVVSKVVQVTA